jgi:hypothetical protein
MGMGKFPTFSLELYKNQDPKVLVWYKSKLDEK